MLMVGRALMALIFTLASVACFWFCFTEFNLMFVIVGIVCIAFAIMSIKKISGSSEPKKKNAVDEW